jgi:hypothetical protein
MILLLQQLLLQWPKNVRDKDVLQRTVLKYMDMKSPDQLLIWSEHTRRVHSRSGAEQLLMFVSSGLRP